jgi:hypothetical protein
MIRQANLDERELIRRVRIRIETAELAFTPKADYLLLRTPEPVSSPSGTGVQRPPHTEAEYRLTSIFRQVLLHRLGITQCIELLSQDWYGACRSPFTVVVIEFGNGRRFRFLGCALFKWRIPRRRRGNHAFGVLGLDWNPIEDLATDGPSRLHNLQALRSSREVVDKLCTKRFVIHRLRGSRISVRRYV